MTHPGPELRFGNVFCRLYAFYAQLDTWQRLQAFIGHNRGMSVFEVRVDCV